MGCAGMQQSLRLCCRTDAPLPSTAAFCSLAVPKNLAVTLQMFLLCGPSCVAMAVL